MYLHTFVPRISPISPQNVSLAMPRQSNKTERPCLRPVVQPRLPTPSSGPRIILHTRSFGPNPQRLSRNTVHTGRVGRRCRHRCAAHSSDTKLLGRHAAQVQLRCTQQARRNSHTDELQRSVSQTLCHGLTRNSDRPCIRKEHLKLSQAVAYPPATQCRLWASEDAVGHPILAAGNVAPAAQGCVSEVVANHDRSRTCQRVQLAGVPMYHRPPTGCALPSSVVKF